MAATPLTRVLSSISGGTLTPANPNKTDGNTIANTDKPAQSRLIISNGSATDSITVTQVTTSTVAESGVSLAVADKPVTVPAGGVTVIGPWSSANFSSTVSLTWSGNAAAEDVSLLLIG